MLDLGQVQHHLRDLTTGDEAVREKALRALKAAERDEWEAVAPDVVDRLVDALREQIRRKGGEGAKRGPAHIRQGYITVLGNLGPRAVAAVPQLIEMLDESEAHGVREAAAAALGKIGKAAGPAVDKLLAILDSECPALLAVRAARALGEIGSTDRRVHSTLSRLWLGSISCPNSRTQIAISLCKLKCDANGLIATLTSTLVTGKDAALRSAAAEALAWCNKKDVGVVPALTAALHDADENVRNTAQSGLKRMKLSLAAAVELCATQLKECPHAEAALRHAGLPSVPGLVAALKSPEADVREKAARILGGIGEPAVDAAAPLTKALRDRHAEVRLSAAKALWLITKQADAVVPALVELLDGKLPPSPTDGETLRRFLQSVIETLGRIGPPAHAATAALNKKARDGNRLISESAVRALRLVNPVAASTP